MFKRITRRRNAALAAGLLSLGIVVAGGQSAHAAAAPGGPDDKAPPTTQPCRRPPCGKAPPRPDPGVPAPPRFLPEYDNLLLSFAERGRVIPHRRPVPLPPGNGAAGGTLLVDGWWQADWKISRDKQRAVLGIQPFTELSRADTDAVAAEGERLLEFATPAGTDRDIRFRPLRSG